MNNELKELIIKLNALTDQANIEIGKLNDELREIGGVIIILQNGVGYSRLGREFTIHLNKIPCSECSRQEKIIIWKSLNELQEAMLKELRNYDFDIAK